MKCKCLVALILLAATAPAIGKQIAPVRVSGAREGAIAMSCMATTTPPRADVERILQINDSRQTRPLARRLVAAVGEACNAGVAVIEVQRAASGQSLTWRPLREDISVASN
jgi:hypothetical protein